MVPRSPRWFLQSSSSIRRTFEFEVAQRLHFSYRRRDSLSQVLQRRFEREIVIDILSAEATLLRSLAQSVGGGKRLPTHQTNGEVPQREVGVGLGVGCGLLWTRVERDARTQRQIVEGSIRSNAVQGLCVEPEEEIQADGSAGWLKFLPKIFYLLIRAHFIVYFSASRLFFSSFGMHCVEF